MKPRTKEERKIVDFKFKKIEINPIRVLKSVGYKTKTKTSCLVCGGDFIEGNICPHCNNKLIVIESRKAIFEEEKKYVEIIETIDDYQVIRQFYVLQYAKKGQARKPIISEVMRWVINPKNKVYLLAKATSYCGWNFAWSLGSEFELRNVYYEKYAICPHIVYKKPKFLERFKYCQYSNKFGVSTIEYLNLYIKHPEIEMLAKTNNGYLIRAIDRNKISIYGFRKEIITVIKNNYIIPYDDIEIWRDYINNLKFFGKDTTNPKYACPEDLRKEHRKLLEKKNVVIYENDQIEYETRIKKWNDLILEENDINISVIKTLEQMKHEGNLLKHCVFKNKYFKHQNSLILSARNKDEVVETVEIDLEKKRINQARGLRNHPSKYHEKVVALVNNNMKKIINVGSYLGGKF